MIDHKEYSNAIPRWCGFRTIEEHNKYIESGFCKILVDHIKNDTDLVDSCQSCVYFDINADEW
jgi:hypothetical protein